MTEAERPLKSARSLMLTTGFPPQPGGVEKLAYAVARHSLVRSVVLAPSAHGDRAFDAESGVPTVRVELGATGLSGKLGYQTTWRLHPALYYLAKFWRPALQVAAREKPHVVQCGHVYLALSGWLLARHLRVPYTVYTHAQEVLRGKRHGAPGLDGLARGRMLRDAGAVFAPSDYTRALVLSWGVEPARVTKIPYGARLPKLEPRATGPGWRILTVGRLVERKGIDTVIQALPVVRARYPDVRYTIVGSGPDRPRLERLARSSGVEQCVEFVGTVSEAELYGYYRLADVYAMPVRETADGEVEGFGIVYLEAAAHGLPCIAGRSGGAAEAVLDGVTGLLVDPAEPYQTAQALLRLLGDPGEARRLGQAGRLRVEREMNWESTARVVDSVLEELVAGA